MGRNQNYKEKLEAHSFSSGEDKDQKGFHKQIKDYFKVGCTHLLFVPKKHDKNSQ